MSTTIHGPVAAPWPDFAGNPLHEGDTIKHPDGTTARVVLDASRDDPASRWRAVYEDGESLWLGNQISGKGRAVKAE